MIVGCIHFFLFFSPPFHHSPPSTMCHVRSMKLSTPSFSSNYGPKGLMWLWNAYTSFLFLFPSSPPLPTCWHVLFAFKWSFISFHKLQFWTLRSNVVIECILFFFLFPFLHFFISFSPPILNFRLSFGKVEDCVVKKFGCFIFLIQRIVAHLLWQGWNVSRLKVGLVVCLWVCLY